MKSFSFLKVVGCLLVSFVLMLSVSNGQSIPQKMTFQGKLLESGSPVTGLRNFIFEFVGTGWSEPHNNVSVNNGVYTVTLGETTLIPITVFTAGPTVNLRITVNGTVLTPDVQVLSSGYSYRAEKSADADKIGGYAVSTLAPTVNYYLKWNGTQWAPAALVEADGVIGNEVTNATPSGGLIRVGAGTGGSPYTLGVEFAGSGGANTVARSDHSHTTDHPRLHTMTSNIDHSATGWRMFYSNASGYVTELGLGTSGQVLQSTGATSAPSWATPNGGSGVTGRVTFWSGTNTLSSDAEMFWDNTNKVLGLGTGTPNTSAKVDIASNTKGFLIPRMTSAQRTAIASPALGLQVFDNTTNTPWYYAGAQWNEIQKTGLDWLLTGNAGTNPSTNYIGTSDVQDLVFKSSATERLRIRSGGNIYGLVGTGLFGLGTSAPVYKLHVEDTTQAAFIYSGTNVKGKHGLFVWNYSNANKGTGFGYANSINAIVGYAYWGMPYHFGVAGYRFDDGYGNSGGVFGASSTSDPPETWGSLGFQDASYREYGMYALSSTATSQSAAAYAENTYTGTNGWIYGIHGKVNSTSASGSPGIGVLGMSGASTGGGVGVFGQSNGTTGTGVKAVANSSTGVNYGIVAGTNSSDGFAGYFIGGNNYFEGNVGIGITNPPYPLYVTSAQTGSTSAVIYGNNSATSASPWLYGVHGRVNSSSSDNPSIGVLGQASNTTGNSVGVWGEAYGSTGRAVRGVALHASGVNYAIQGICSSSNGYAGYFSGGKNYFSGNVGIGESLPTHKLHVESTGSTHSGYFLGTGTGISYSTLYAENTSTSSGIALSIKSAGTDATMTVEQASGASGPMLKMFGQNGGNEEIRILNDGNMRFYNSSYTMTIELDPSETGGSTDAGQITMYNGSGTAVIELDGDYGGTGKGRATVSELEITGGSDLAEFFDVMDDQHIEPGIVLSIDPENPGKLKVCDKAYDHCVAGIVSGGSDVDPGIILSHKGTQADGKHLVALTGRVFCQVDATQGPVKPGDLLTTSDTPGYAMKVTDHQKAQGAIIGKAMTALESGKGLVLVLVSLQ